MRPRFLAFALLAIGFGSCLTTLYGQSAEKTDPSQAEVLITKLGDPVYPRIAHVANIHGDVTLALRIRPDGSVESLEYVSGPPLLKQAALDSAKESQFACQRCGNGAVSYSLVYTFQLSNENCCNTPDGPPKVSISQNHISVTIAPFCFCDPPVAIGKVRSLKCLYLWRCARR